MVIALAVGTWAGLGGTDQWRRQSNDQSFAILNMHDIRVELTPGSFASEGDLAAVLSSIEHSEWIVASEERLLLPTQVDATIDNKAILAPGEILGVGNNGEPTIDAIEIRSGSAMSQEPGVLLDVHFATQNDRPPTGQIRLSGGVTLPYVGHGLSPEYFVVVSDRGGLFAGSSYAVVFAPLPMLQELSDHSNEVNQLVLTSTAEAVPDVLAGEVSEAIEAALPGIGFTLTPVAEETSFRLLYDDIENDQRFYNIFAGLISTWLAGWWSRSVESSGSRWRSAFQPPSSLFDPSSLVYRCHFSVLSSGLVLGSP